MFDLLRTVRFAGLDVLLAIFDLRRFGAFLLQSTCGRFALYLSNLSFSLWCGFSFYVFLHAVGSLTLNIQRGM